MTARAPGPPRPPAFPADPHRARLATASLLAHSPASSAADVPPDDAPATPPATSPRWGRLLLSVALAVYGIACLRDPAEWRLLDGVNLAIHETGHLVFGAFGDFIAALGGTLFQLIVPTAFVVEFVRRGDRHAATVALWWVAQNLWNVSVYVADARAELLPLVGGGEHDWAFLLADLGWLQRDLAIARGVHAAGVAIFAVATVAGLVLAWGVRSAPVRPPAAPSPPA